jgi:hypothetical protein
MIALISKSINPDPIFISFQIDWWDQYVYGYYCFLIYTPSIQIVGAQQFVQN